MVSVAARGPGGTAMEEFAFRNQYAWKGLVGVQSVAGERQNIPLTVLVNGNPNANTSVLLHLDMYDKNMSNVEEIKARRGPIIAVATEGDRDISRKADDVIYIPRTVDCLQPLLTVVPLQLLAYHIAVLRGCDVDKPRNLAKSVTVE